MVFYKKTPNKSDTNIPVDLHLENSLLPEALSKCDEDTVTYINALIKLKPFEQFPIFRPSKEQEQVNIYDLLCTITCFTSLMDWGI